ncbi:HEAT repeat domain-containing protein [Hymenobacter tibetensis]|uniref:HEAT repeat domain-containing protein n=1 Tax=Hymenobacter tibetensis TaxID=497967 RepID=A0ABY4CV89_9BACT|nr:HEAT repeat domain-containing protein [Hymenobacter tibetensis]UOG73957.1 HEAT repeat domain-containing protein [Hymenobacter tibetensis]
MNESFNHQASTPADCEAIAPLLAGYAEKELSAVETAQVEAHLPACLACRTQLKQLRELLACIDDQVFPMPPLALRDNFLAQLAEEKMALPKATATPSEAPAEAKVVAFWAPTPTARWLRIAASIALLAVGALFGLILRPATSLDVASQQPAASETLAAHLTAATSQPATASRRISLVAEAPATVQPGDPAVQVLINTLNADPNPNVRLAACEALFRLRADPRVGPALVQALPNQNDPNVQITLIELLVALRDKRAVPTLERLSRQPEALPAVRQQAANGLGLLI